MPQRVYSTQKVCLCLTSIYPTANSFFNIEHGTYNMEHLAIERSICQGEDQSLGGSLRPKGRKSCGGISPTILVHDESISAILHATAAIDTF